MPRKGDLMRSQTKCLLITCVLSVFATTALAVGAALAFVAAGSGATAAELSEQEQALLRKVVAANQRLEQALPLSSFYCEYTRTWESALQQPGGIRRTLYQKTSGTFAFERGGDSGIAKIAVEETFLDARTEPIEPGSRPFQAGDRTKTMRLGDAHYQVTTMGGTNVSTKGKDSTQTFMDRRRSPWNMLFDFKAEPLTQLDKPESVRVMVSIDQYWVGQARVTAVRRGAHEGRPTVELDVDFAGHDQATDLDSRILYTFRLAADMDFLPVEVRRTGTMPGRDDFRYSGVTTVEKALRLETSRGQLWIPARISNTGGGSEGTAYGQDKETYEVRQDTVRHDTPVPAAVFAFDSSGAYRYYDADAERERNVGGTPPDRPMKRSMAPARECGRPISQRRSGMVRPDPSMD